MNKLIAFAAFVSLPLAAAEQFTMAADWRLFDAGRAVITTTSTETTVNITSLGVVGKLHPVNDQYRSTYGEGMCVLSATMHAAEGDGLSETTVRYGNGKARSEEKDLKDGKVEVKEVDIPACVSDVIGGLLKLRTMKMTPGTEATVPVSDGKRYVAAKVQAQKIEMVSTPAGKFRAIRHEAFLMNGLFFRRKGHLLIWLTDDDRRVPVQIQVQLPFYVGDVTLKLESMGIVQAEARASSAEAILRR